MEKRRRLASLLILLGLALLVPAGGCSRRFFRQRADNAVDSLLREKDKFDAWKIEQYHVEPDPRARFAGDGNPDRPPMPPDDPAAAELSPKPQKPGKAGTSLLESEGYIELLAEWDRENRASDKPPPQPITPPSGPLASTAPLHRFRLKLEQAVELALLNSREFQDRREDLYLTALPVTTERYAFSAQFFATEQLIRERLGRLFPGGPSDRWVANTNLGFSKLFTTGALLLFRFANRTVYEIANRTTRRTVSESTIDLDLIQPLLRGGGRAVTLEPLTLAERNLLYEIRDYAHFRKQFFVSIAGGADIGATAIGATRFRNRPTAFGLNTFLPGADIRPGLGDVRGIPASGFAQASGYLPVVLNQLLLENERENLSKLQEILVLFRAQAENPDRPLSSVQVGRVEQQLLQGRTSATQRDQTLREALDRFKLQLGVPVDLPLELDDAPVLPQRRQLERFARILKEVEAVRQEADKLAGLEDPAMLRRELRRLAITAPLVQGTVFRTDFLRVWGEWTRCPAEALRIQLLRDRALLRELLNQRDALEREQKPIPAELLRRLEQMRFEEEVGRFEQSLRAYETLPLARLAAAVGAAAAGPFSGGVPLLPRGQGTGSEQANRFDDVKETFLGLLIPARSERLAQVQKTWTTVPPVCVEGADLLATDLDRAETVVTRTALENRFELMNTRAQLVDSWRQIAVAANSLLGTFNIEYHLTSITPPGLDRPFAFSGSRSRHQLVFNGELPLVRMLERNNYRASLIGWQRQRRTLMATEDTIVAGVRAQLRQLRVLAENYRIQQQSVELAYLQVENSLDIFRAPPPPPPLTGPDPSAATQQLLEGQRNLIDAQNRLATVWVQYLTTRLQLYRDLELMPLDFRGVWIDDVATCHCPPGPRPRDAEGEAPPPRSLEPQHAGGTGR